MTFLKILTIKPIYPVVKYTNNYFKKKAPRLYSMIRYHSNNANTQKYWDTRYSKEEKDKFQNRNYEKLHEKVLTLCPDRSKVLDVGCGGGILLKKAKDKKICEVYGVDFSSVAVNVCKKNGLNVIQSKLPDIPYTDNSFDVVICSEVLEHLSEPEKTIKQMLRVLKPNGTFIITVPYEEEDNTNLEHVNNFSEQSISKIFPSNYTINFDYSEEDLFVSDEKWHFRNMIVYGKKP